jgi:hypothetical protein
MNLKLVSFADSGNLERERVVLKAAEDADVGDYTALCSSTTVPNTANPGLSVAFWFPSAKVKKDDIVVLYTKHGKQSKKRIGGGHTAYFFYWGVANPIWNASTSALVLIESADWTIEWPAETVEPEEPKKPSPNVPAAPPSK